MSDLGFFMRLLAFVMTGIAGALFWGDFLRAKNPYGRAIGFLGSLIAWLVSVGLFVTLILEGGSP